MVANCGPPGANQQALTALFAAWDPAAQVTLPPIDRGHCFVSLATAEAASAAQAALAGTTQPSLPGSGPLLVCFAERKDTAASGEAGEPAAGADPPLVAVRTAEECGIPGLACLPGFVSQDEEAALLQEADAQAHWQSLARRRVLHLGHIFDYEVGC